VIYFEWVLIVIFSYLLGSIPFGVLITRHTGKDPRKIGSGNIGAANIIRNFGWKLGFLVLFFDALKGLVPVAVAQCLNFNPWFILCIGISAVLGHCFSPFLKFKGGKGVATSLGVVVGINWVLALIGIFTWLLILITIRYSSLGSLTAAIVVLFLSTKLELNLAYHIFYILLAIFVLFTHRKNIIRLFKGEETKIDMFKPKKLATGLERKDVKGELEELANFSGKLNNPVNSKNWAFLIHPLELEDLEMLDPTGKIKGKIDNYKNALAKWQIEQSKPEHERDPKIGQPRTHIFAALNFIGAKIIGEGYCIFKKKISYGVFVLVPYLPEQFVDALNGNKKLAEKIKQSIIDAIKIARDANAQYAGLGVFTSIFTKAGYDLEKLRLGPLTSGNAATGASIYKGVLDACKKMGINPNKSTVCVVGATGSVGRPVTLMLARRFKRIIICAKDIKKLEDFRSEIQKENPKADIFIENDVNEAIKNANAVIFAVSATKREMKINPESFKPGAICCDASRPLVLSEDFIEKRQDVLFMEGAIIKGPWVISCPKLLRMGGDNLGFGCLVETIVRALESEEKSQGYGVKVTVEEAEKCFNLLFKKYKFQLAGYRIYNRQYSLPHILLIKLNATIRSFNHKQKS